MQPVFIVAAVRTPLGKWGGALSEVRADDLLALTFAEVVSRGGVDPASVDEVFAGCANQAGEDNRNVARMSWLLAGFPYATPAVTVNRLCASGLDAVVQGARAIATGDAEVVVAGGVESMSRAPLVMGRQLRGHREAYDSALGWRFPNTKMADRFPLESMGETAENIQRATGISRGEQDAYALESHRRALAADFSRELVAVGGLSCDECPRADTSMAQLARLRPSFRHEGTVTAGTASSLSDGAAALLLASETAIAKWGLAPRARIIACAAAGVDPRTMGLGPVPATHKALRKSGVAIDDLEWVEVNEAFAVQVLAVQRALGLSAARVNPRGGAIALGHPLGCSGARILTTALHGMEDGRLSLGLVTLCVGVGQGHSMIVRRER
jgi:acetyl-CoA acetyltransferase family protein